MRESDMLAGLVAQAEGRGGDLVTIRALIEEGPRARPAGPLRPRGGG